MPRLLRASLLGLLVGSAAADGAAADEACVAGDDCAPPVARRGSALMQSHTVPKLIETSAEEEGVASAHVQNLVATAKRVADAGRNHSHGVVGASKEADDLASLVKTWSASGTSGPDRTHLSGIDKNELKNIQDVLNTTLFGNLGNFTSEDQAEVNSDYDVLVQCDTARQTTEEGPLALDKQAQEAASKDHKECRQTESQLVTAKQLAKAALDALEQSTPPPPACPSYPTKRQYFGTDNALKTWYETYAPIFANKESASTNATQQATAQKTHCDSIQVLAEQTYCTYSLQLQTACGTYASCRNAHLPKYANTVQRVKHNVAGRKALYKSGLAIMCHLDVILGQNSKTHDVCTTLIIGHDPAHLDVTYPEAPTTKPCSTSGYTRSPCDAGWIADEFSGWMPSDVSAAPCSRCSWETSAPTPAPASTPTSAPTPASPR